MSKFGKLGKKVKTKDIKRSKRVIRQIAVHCAFTPPDLDIGAKEINQWHKQRGWSGIGYHYIIRRDGTVEIGRDVDYAGAHVHGYNRYTIGMSYVGGAKRSGKKLVSDIDNATKAQRKTIIALSHHLAKIHELPTRDILGHNEFPNVHKSCPNLSMTAIREGQPVQDMKPPYSEPQYQKFRFSKRSLRRLKATGNKTYINQMKSAIKYSPVDITIKQDGTWGEYPTPKEEGERAIKKAIIAVM